MNTYAQMDTATLIQTQRELWRKACTHDRIPPDSPFAVFSDDNPHAIEHNNAMLVLMNRRQR